MMMAVSSTRTAVARILPHRGRGSPNAAVIATTTRMNQPKARAALMFRISLPTSTANPGSALISGAMVASRLSCSSLVIMVLPFSVLGDASLSRGRTDAKEGDSQL